MARDSAVGFPHRTGEEDPDILLFDVVLVDGVPIGLLKLREVKGGIGEEQFLFFCCRPWLSLRCWWVERDGKGFVPVALCFPHSPLLVHGVDDMGSIVVATGNCHMTHHIYNHNI